MTDWKTRREFPDREGCCTLEFVSLSEAEEKLREAEAKTTGVADFWKKEIDRLLADEAERTDYQTIEDRKRFAAAALTGLLASPHPWPEDPVSFATRTAEAMLRALEGRKP